MKRVVTAVVLTAACGLGVMGGAAPASAATRPVVVMSLAFSARIPSRAWSGRRRVRQHLAQGAQPPNVVVHH